MKSNLHNFFKFPIKLQCFCWSGTTWLASANVSCLWTQ